MPKYRVVEKSLIGNEIHEEGDIVEYDGLPGWNLEPQDDAGRAKAAEYEASNKERVAKMNAENAGGIADPAAFVAALIAANKENAAAQADQIANAVAQALAAIFPNGVPVKGTVQLPQ